MNQNICNILDNLFTNKCRNNCNYNCCDKNNDNDDNNNVLLVYVYETGQSSVDSNEFSPNIINAIIQLFSLIRSVFCFFGFLILITKI